MMEEDECTNYFVILSTCDSAIFIRIDKKLHFLHSVGNSAVLFYLVVLVLSMSLSQMPFFGAKTQILQGHGTAWPYFSRESFLETKGSSHE